LQQQIEVGLGLTRKATMKVERSVRSEHISRQRSMRAMVFSCAAGRFMRLSTSGAACCNGMSR